MEKRVLGESHAPVCPIKSEVVAQRQVELVLDVGKEIVRIVVNHILDDVNPSGLLQISNDRQDSADHVDPSLLSVSPRNVFSLFSFSVAKLGNPFPAKNKQFGSTDGCFAD